MTDAPTDRPAGPGILLLALSLVALAAVGAAVVLVPGGSPDAPPASTTTSLPRWAQGPPPPAPTTSGRRVEVPEPSGRRVVDAVELPDPEPLPRDPYAPTPPEELGRIEIPALGLDEELNVGMTLTAINRGPSWWPGTAAPGQVGTTVIAGHRTTWSRPFYDLDRLVPGDRVVLTSEDGRFEYAVSSVDVISPSDLSIAEQRWEHRAVLFACHPKGSARFRLAARLVLVDADGVPVDDGIEWRFGEPSFVDPLVALDRFGDEVLGSPDAVLHRIHIDGRVYDLAGPPPDESTIWLAPEPLEIPSLDHLGLGDEER